MTHFQKLTVKSIKKNKSVKILLLFFILVLTVVVLFYIKYFYVAGHGIECFTYKYFGIYCMGCGSTRQLYYALNGEFKKAFYYNVACVIIYPAYIYLYYLIIRWSIKDKKINYKQAYVLAAVALTLTVYMILRNIPIEIFDILRPVG